MIVDISSHNLDNDFKKAKEAGVKAVLIRCGYGSDHVKYDDPYFVKNIEGALANGLKVGVYLYSYAKSGAFAISEADHALRLIKPYKDKLSLPVFYDVEEKGTEEGVSTRCKLFCDKLRSKGYKVGVYASLWWWETYLKDLDTSNIYIWLAKWGGSKPSHKLDIWQYDAYGKVPGIGTGVDLNNAYGELADIINGVTPTPTPTPTPKEGIELKVELLKKGNKGAEVFAVQSILRAQGYKYDGTLIKCDSSYGKITEACVVSFQKKNGLVADGIVGAKTWDKLVNG